MLTQKTNINLQNMQNASLFLGYTTSFRNPKMFFTLCGVRNSIDIHNLNFTQIQIESSLRILYSSLKNFGIFWVVEPNNNWINSNLKNGFSAFQNLAISQYFYVWTEKWIPGFFNNPTTSYNILEKSLKYPHILFYLNHTKNLQRLADGKSQNLLQIGVADSNSTKKAYTYFISANEKTKKSSEFFVRLLASTALLFSVDKKSKFLKCQKK